MVDWSLAGKVAEGVAALAPSGDPGAVPVAGPARGRVRGARLRLHGADAGRGRAAGGRGDRAAGVDRGEPALDPRACSIRPPRRRPQSGGPLGAVIGGAAGARARRRGRARSPATSRGACSGSTSSRCSTRTRRRGCCSSRPTSATPRRRSRPSPTRCCAGSRCTRSRTRCSSAASRGCGPHLAGMVRELVAGARLRPRAAAQRHARASTTCAASSTPSARTGSPPRCSGPSGARRWTRVQAFMAVLEGYAEHVMDAVGADVIDDLPRLRAAMERRRADRTGLLRLFEKVIGHGHEAAPVRAGQALLRRRRRAGRDRRRSTASGRRPTGSRRSPSSTRPPSGWRASSRSPPEPPSARPPVGAGSARRSKRTRGAGRSTLLARGRTHVPDVTKSGGVYGLFTWFIQARVTRQ